MLKKFLLSVTKFEWVFLTALFLFSTMLMSKTFGIDSSGNIQIASKAWSDFAATLPLIRSFSYGDNFPPEYPIYAGPPIRYHFAFFALVGFLEKIGFRLDFAFNGLSIIFFFLLLAVIYFFGKTVFKNKIVGIISVFLFLFNGSFGFLEYFTKHPVFSEAISSITKNTEFSSFGPYDGKIVSAFWNLNIYTNQRHLALGYFAYLIFFLTLFLLNKNPHKFTYKLAIFLGVLLGIFPFIHLSVFLMIGLTLLILFAIYPLVRKQIFIMGIVAILLALPQFLYMGTAEVDTQIWKPGYLVLPVTFVNFIKYWFLNIGLTLVLAPIGFYLANKNQRRILIPFLAFFVVGNLFQLSPDMPTNHKFFNLAVIGLNFYTAFFLSLFWKKSLFKKLILILILIPLTLTGLIDLFPILNDKSITLEDIPNNKAATFIKETTPKDSTFLNSSFLYTPASLAGRKIFMGWPYFAWSAGYDTNNRAIIIEKIYTSKSKSEICSLLKQHKLDYFTTENTEGNRDFPTIDLTYFDNNFIKEYTDGVLTIYKTSNNCGL